MDFTKTETGSGSGSGSGSDLVNINGSTDPCYRYKMHPMQITYVAENGGTHWVAISYQGQFIFYFDSFGAPPPTDVLKWLKKSRRKIAYNNVIIQALESTLCGFYCIYYLYYVNRVQTKKTLHERSNEFISKFSHDPDVNAGILRNGLSLILKLHTLPKRIYMALMKKIKYT